ncbi:formin-like protein 13 [Eutrema salsugineum]|uniref:formin-like protein 13 n=1 Tax=Eutrema salsugineum TaxID=72664 RepID=UPI000CED4A58|nr:formin-like protein 13 [Eutrema salsugineum]
MALFRKLFYRKPPDGLLEISDRVFVFDCCLSTDCLEEENYKVYVAGVVNQLQEHFPDASSLVFNFREVGARSVMADVLSEHGLTIMDYPRHYEGCSLLPVKVMHHFLRSSEIWLSLGPNNLLLMHCERGAWPVLAFTLAALLIYRKQYSGEYKTLDMIYKRAPRELLHLFSPLNPIPSQLRYLQYLSRRNLVSEWPPLDVALTMDCVILNFIADVSGQGACRPIFRVYGQDPSFVDDKRSKLLFSTLKKGNHPWIYKQAECELVKIDINCHVQGDIVIECLTLNDDMEREAMLFRVAFNTAFIRSNILMLNRDEVDTLWHLKEQFPKEFRVELLFSDMEAASSVDLMDFSGLEEKDGLPIDVSSKVHEFFNQVDSVDQNLAIANAVQGKPDGNSSPRLQGLSPKSINDIMKHAAIESSVQFKLSEVDTVDPPEKGPTDSVKKLIVEDIHSVLQISSQENPTSQDATNCSRQGSPSLKLVHHSATVKLFVDDSDFSENAEENILKSPPPENHGNVVSFSPYTPSPSSPSLAPTEAPLPPLPLPTVAPPTPVKTSPPRLVISSASPPTPTRPPPPPLGKPRAPSGPPHSRHIVPPRPVLPTIKLKPYYWLKLTRAVTGSIWAETQMSGGASKAAEIDRKQLEICFPAAAPVQRAKPPKLEKVRLIESKRAYNCEIMLSNVKVPLQDLMYSVLNLEESALDADKVENLIKFCPTTEEIEKLTGYNGDKDMLGKCELFFLEMMKVPRVEKKLRVLSFKIQFCSQISELRNSLSVVNSAAEQIKSSEKFKRIMQTILALGNALNQGTSRGNAVGFKLDSLPKLSETRATNYRRNLMHYLCWILSEKIPEVLDFPKDLSSLEPATKIQLKFLADEMQALNKGLENVEEELSSSKKDGPISDNFNKILKEFLHYAEGEVRSLASLYSGVVRNLDGLILYFGEDPAKYPFEQVVSTLLNFVRLFNRAHEETVKYLEAEAKKSAETEK